MLAKQTRVGTQGILCWDDMGLRNFSCVPTVSVPTKDGITPYYSFLGVQFI